MKEKTTQVKICGLTRQEEVKWILEEKADYFGIVLFFPKSRRNNSIENAGKLLAVCQAECEKRRREDENFAAPVSVAVTVSPTPEQIRQIESVGFNMIQIHGELPGETLDAVSIPVIRAFTAAEMDACHQYDGCPKIAAYLFDAQSPGSGTAFDWTLLSALLEKTASAENAAGGSGNFGKKMIFLAGGLNGGNVKEAVQKIHPDAVDVSSGVERNDVTADGTVMKDREKIREFIRKVREDE
ncbi:MAG: phosphoribosylanthranilate isomerase [Bacillus sp. (in: Bacteria)]|nr:phosphoribosylanthranilate isomerase [Bacillus sp. (in: firmicutes)]MCM1426343.1 phosphoribosylanthranilate isomerase [Eubacterium sp.]